MKKGRVGLLLTMASVMASSSHPDPQIMKDLEYKPKGNSGNGSRRKRPNYRPSEEKSIKKRRAKNKAARKSRKKNRKK